MPRRRKPGPRTKSGRLSRAYKSPQLRDHGTAEAQAKRHALINGADPQLAATASGILLANGFIDGGQHAAALIYARCHALVFGKPWPYECPLAHELAHHGSEPPEDMLRRARERLDAMNGRLGPEPRRAVANLAVFGHIPTEYYVQRCGWRALPEDEKDWQALLTGLNALRSEGAMKKPKDRPEPRRPALDREPEPDEAATAEQVRHINADRLRARLREMNP